MACRPRGLAWACRSWPRTWAPRPTCSSRCWGSFTTEGAPALRGLSCDALGLGLGFARPWRLALARCVVVLCLFPCGCKVLWAASKGPCGLLTVAPGRDAPRRAAEVAVRMHLFACGAWDPFLHAWPWRLAVTRRAARRRLRRAQRAGGSCVCDPCRSAFASCGRGWPPQRGGRRDQVQPRQVGRDAAAGLHLCGGAHAGARVCG